MSECEHTFYMREAGIQCTKCLLIWESEKANMTHDELLAEIDDNFTKCGDDCESCRRDNASWSALRAVVELHKSQDITLPNGEWGINCVECDGLFYPCLTIQAIEKELK
jgi:hypothetical protein